MCSENRERLGIASYIIKFVNTNQNMSTLTIIINCHFLPVIPDDYRACRHSIIGVNEYCFAPKGTDSS